MNKENLIKEMKSEMIKILNKIEYENFYQCQSDLEKYFKVMELVWELPTSNENQTFMEEDEIDFYELDFAGLEESKDQENGKYEGKVKLKLGGGDIGSFHIFIPEKLVRRLDIEDGDWVRATEIDQRIVNGYTKPIYDYRIIRKAEEDQETNREVVKFATVSYDDTLEEYYILSSEIENTPTKIILSDQRLGNLSVNEYDIVDYAYWKEDILNGKVIWKHNMHFDLARTRKYDSDFEDIDLMENFLEGDRICFVGKPKQVEDYKLTIENYGGQVSFLTPGSSFHVVESELEEVDLALIFVDSLSAAELKKVYDAAENMRIATIYAKEMDTKSLMYWICDMLQIREYKLI